MLNTAAIDVSVGS